MTPGSTEDPPAPLSLPHNCAYATGRDPSVAAGFGDIRVLQGSREDAPRDPTTIHTPGTGCLGMNPCVKSQLHTGDKLAFVCLSPALSPCWGHQTLALNGIFLCPVAASASSEKKSWWRLWVCISE